MTRSTGCALALALAFASACGGSSLRSSAQSVVVAVEPGNALVNPGGSLAFRATVTGSASSAVTWSMSEGASGGTIGADGVYVAPQSVGTYHVLATSAEGAVGQATVEVATLYALPADRMTLFKPGVTYNGGIPPRTTTCATLGPSGGDDTAAVNKALKACPAGQAVLLKPGNFKVSGSSGISVPSNVTLRGSGAGVTFVQAGNAGVVVSFGPGWYHDSESSWTGQVALASDAVKESYAALLVGPTGAQVGEIVHVDEQYDPALTWYNAAQGQTTDYLGFGEYRTPGLGSQAADWAASRPMGQALQIATLGGSACTGSPNPNCVTFTTPFHKTFRVSQKAWLARVTTGSLPYASVSNAGVENMTVLNGSAGDGWGNIVFYVASNCWAKNVESIGASVTFIGSLQCELRDSYVHTGGSDNPGGGGYGVVVDTYSADNLVENNIVWSFNKVDVMRGSGGGNVVAYNYLEDGYGSGYPMIVEVGPNASHMAGSHYELFEGNQSFNCDSDSTWGNADYIIFFRNHLTGVRRSIHGSSPGALYGPGPTTATSENYGPATGGIAGPGVAPLTLTDSSNKRVVGLTVHQWYYSFVGNLLGYPAGYLQNPAIGFPYPKVFSPEPQSSIFWYEWAGTPSNKGLQPGGASGQYTALWQMGYDGGSQGDPGWYTTQDGSVIGTGAATNVIRDGNYDFFTQLQHWHGLGGVATDSVSGAGATTPPAVSTLPASLYIPAGTVPAFFGTDRFPWTDPTTGTIYTLPARARFDAGTPNTVP